MSWTTIASDDFNRANGLLTSPWVQDGWLGRVLPTIFSNQIRTSSDGSYAAANRTDLGTVNEKQFAEMDHIFVNSSRTYTTQFNIRMSHVSYADLQIVANRNLYYMFIEGNSVVSPGAAIYVLTGGSFTQVGSYHTFGAPLPGTGTVWTVRAEADGSNISAKLTVGGVTYTGTRTDATHPTGSPAGIHLDNSVLSRNDNWAAGHWVLASPLLLMRRHHGG